MFGVSLFCRGGMKMRKAAMSLNPEVRLEIRHLKLLAAVAEQGSVTEAGRQLHVTQSALSHQLRDAEEKLGTALFLRLGKKMVLTSAGEKLLGSARKVLEELRTAESQIEGLNGGTRGVIRVSTECYTCYHWLPPVLKKFHAKFPGVDVKIVLEATARPIAALLDGKLDIAVTSSPVHNRTLRFTPTCEDELVLVMDPQHRLADSPHVQPRDLACETVFCYPPKEESTLVLRVLRPAHVEPARIQEVPLTESIVDMVSAGLGVALLARWAVKNYVTAGRIVARSVNKTGFRRRWYAVTLRSQTMTPYMTEFLNLLARTCSQDSAPS
jgi:LysR family transcriptional regulator for metE and metH